MEIIETGITGLVVIQPKVYVDARGCFSESYHLRRYQDLGISSTFCQDNLSMSKRGVLRGLHFQSPNSQAKLVNVVFGEVFDVAVDLRKESSTFAKWFGVTLTGKKQNQIYIPPGFAHGFCVLSDSAYVHYKSSDFYSPESEYCLRWDDPEIAIQWPISNPLLSEKDANAHFLRKLPSSAFISEKFLNSESV